MAGHIFLISCLLATCLPIVLVQLPRFVTVKGLRAETEAETRSAVLRRRPLSPSGTRETLRRITRPWSQTDIDLTSAESAQGQGGSRQAAQTSGGRRWYTSVPRSVFQGDTCADGGCSSKEEDELKKARAGRKPWDSPFRRQLPRTELVRDSPGGRWHAATGASPPRKAGRDLEARGLATRLFPPDPIPETDDASEYDRCSPTSSGLLPTPQEPLHRRPPTKNQPQTHENKGGYSTRDRDSKPPLAPSIPPQRTDAESIPSPLDGSPLPSMCYLSRSAPPPKTKEPPRCPCRHCRHPHSEFSVPQLPSVPPVAPKEPSPPGGSPRCHTCPHTCHCRAPRSCLPVKSKGTPMPCNYPDLAPADSQSQSIQPHSLQDGPRAAPSETTKGTCHDESTDPPKDARTKTFKGAPKASSKACKASVPLWQVLLLTMGFIIFVFAFAILIAQCLAWFLVYKTEARLGEVRSGLLRGGEMKLCLCGRG